MRAMVNEEHPDYPEYIEKCKKLRDKYLKIIDKEEAKYPEWSPKLRIRHPASAAVRRIMKQHDAELMALQAEYDFLFTIIDNSDDVDK